MSPEDDRMVIASFVSSNNTSACNTSFVLASLWEGIKESIRVIFSWNFQFLLLRHQKTKWLYRFLFLLISRFYFVWKIVKLFLISAFYFHYVVFLVIGFTVHEIYRQHLTSDLLFVSLLILPSLLIISVLKKSFCKNRKLALFSKFFWKLLNKDSNWIFIRTTWWYTYQVVQNWHNIDYWCTSARVAQV